MVPPPAPLTCIRFSCYVSYVKKVIHYMLLQEYHKRRLIYAQRHRNDDIPEYYREGEPIPKHLLFEIIKLRRF